MQALAGRSHVMSPEPSAGAAAWLAALTCCYELIRTQTLTLKRTHSRSKETTQLGFHT